MAVPGVQEETSFRTLKAYGLGPGRHGAFRDTPPSPGTTPTLYKISKSASMGGFRNQAAPKRFLRALAIW